MYENAIKIVWGVKNCAPFTKNMALFGEKNLCSFLCYVLLAKFGARLSSEVLVTLTTLTTGALYLLV